MAEIFDLDAIYAEEAGEPFQFRWAGRDWQLPPFREIDLRAIDAFTKLSELAEESGDGMATADMGLINDIFEPAFGPAQWSEWQKVPQNILAITRLIRAWQEHGGDDLGEASASSSSSKSTGRPSKRTSRATTGSASAKRSTAARTSGTRRASS